MDLEKMSDKERTALLRAAAKLQKREEKSEEKVRKNILAKHGHLEPFIETLRQEQHGEGNQTQWCLTVPCESCGKEMRVFTSDLHQKRFCDVCKKAAKKEMAAAMKALLKNPEALKALRAKVSEQEPVVEPVSDEEAVEALVEAESTE